MKSGLVVMLSTLCLLTSCSSTEADEPYPAVISEIVTFRIDDALRMTIRTDEGKVYTVTSEVANKKANTYGRLLCDYVIESDGCVKLMGFQSVGILRDATPPVTTPVHDPAGVVSIWQKGGFINMHLSPKTQSDPFKQGWGFVRDRQRPNLAGGITHELSLHHNQKEDPLAYTSDIYLTLVIDSVSKTFATKDSIELTLTSFDGPYIFRYGK